MHKLDKFLVPISCTCMWIIMFNKIMIPCINYQTVKTLLCICCATSDFPLVIYVINFDVGSASWTDEGDLLH